MFDIDIFSDSLKKEIIAFSLLNKIPITNLIWEERVFNSLVFSGIDEKEIEWVIGSHKSGKDIKFFDYAISLKANLLRKDVACISSYRTTRFATIENKIDFIDNKGKNFTHYLLSLRSKKKDILKYSIYMMEANYIFASNYIWEDIVGQKGEKRGQHVGWTTQYVNGVMLKIVKSMSDQLWIYMDVNNLHNDDRIKLLTEVEIDNHMIGSLWKRQREGIIYGSTEFDLLYRRT